MPASVAKPPPDEPSPGTDAHPTDRATQSQPHGPDQRPERHRRADPDRAATIMGQWRRERPDLDARSIGVITRIWQLASTFSAHRREVLDGLGIDSALLDLLGTLRRDGQPYRLSTRELAQACGVSPAAISQRLTRAEQHGWVTRRPASGRRVEVHLTAEGLAIVDEVAGTIFAADEALLADLAPEERRHLTELLQTLLTRLGESHASPP